MKTTTLAIAAALAAGGAAHAQEAVQWRVEDGGNGHWYVAAEDPDRLTWGEAKTLAEARGGHLPTGTTPDEWAYLTDVTLADLPPAAYVPLGILQDTDGREPAGDWAWLDGPGIPIPWGGLEPNNSGAGEDVGHGFRYPDGIIAVNDYTGSLSNSSSVQWFAIEWSADCNGDGIVDYGQILDGTYEDANGNGVPDCCDEGVDCDPCIGDVNFDGIVNGADISVLLGFWGLNGKPVAADINQDGQVDGTDLANVLGSWGECP